MSTKWRGYPVWRSTPAARPSPAGLPARTGTGTREMASAGQTRQTVRRQRPRFTASISPDIGITGHEHRNAVKHVFQARFELPVPPVLGKSRRQAVHRGETPGVNLV